MGLAEGGGPLCLASPLVVVRGCLGVGRRRTMFYFLCSVSFLGGGSEIEDLGELLREGSSRDLRFPRLGG